MKRQILFIAVGFLTFCVSASESSAQQEVQKKVAKSKPLPLPGEAYPDSSSIKAQRERLELPDVLILGKATSIRKPSEKRVRNKLFKIQMPRVLNVRSVWFPMVYSPPEQTPSFQPKQITHATAAEIQFGTYNTAFIKASHWQQLPRVKLNFHGVYRRSDGQYENSQFTRWHTEASAEYRLSPIHRFHLSIRYLANQYGLWASSQQQRKWHQLTWKAGFTGNFNPQIDYSLDFKESRTPLQKNIEIDPVETVLLLTREKNRWLQGGLTFRSEQWKFQFSSSALANVSQQYQNGQMVTADSSHTALPGYQNSFSRVNLTASRFLGQKGQITFGVVYEFYSQEKGEKKKNRVNPMARVRIHLSPAWRLFTTYEPHWRFVTHQELLELNPFYSSSRDPLPIEDHRHAFVVGLEWKTFAKNVLRVSYSYQAIENFLYWESIPRPIWSSIMAPYNLFQLNVLEKVHLSYLKIEADLGDASSFHVRSTLLFLNSGIDRIGGEMVLPLPTHDIPYLEDVSWPTELTYRFTKDWRLQVEAYYFSSRYFSLQSPEKTRSIWLLNAKLNYSLQGVNFYLFGRNLFNQKFQLWRNYPETGVQFFVGIEAKL